MLGLQASRLFTRENDDDDAIISNDDGKGFDQ